MEEKKTCKSCGKEIDPSAKFCSSCGAKIEIEEKSEPKPPKEKADVPLILSLVFF